MVEYLVKKFVLSTRLGQFEDDHPRYYGDSCLLHIAIRIIKGLLNLLLLGLKGRVAEKESRTRTVFAIHKVATETEVQEDPILLWHEDKDQNPHVAIIKMLALHMHS
ncbi:hypothetical protein RIF29_10532 [Crotalaria pallida]|uniref:Uncharacterized protein n=1 Tax=Crotalaria pallida TaxID=3830 RepID=A0AAN9FSZ2_CROPI